MNLSSTLAACEGHYELRFMGLFSKGRGYVFACDAGGHVAIDDLGAREPNNYFYARAVVGIELSVPKSQWLLEPPDSNA